MKLIQHAANRVYGQNGHIDTVTWISIHTLVEQPDQQILLGCSLRVSSGDQCHVVVEIGRKAEKLACFCVAQESEVVGMPVWVGGDSVQEDHADVIGNGCRAELSKLFDDGGIVLVVTHKSRSRLEVDPRGVGEVQRLHTPVASLIDGHIHAERTPQLVHEELGEHLIMGSAFEHPPLTVSELPALLKAADVGQLGSFGTLARRGAVEAVVVPFQRKIGEIIVGEANVIVGQIRAKRADPVIVGNSSTVDVDNRGDVVTLGEAEGFFEEA